MVNLGFIGAGNMGSAIIKGVIAAQSSGEKNISIFAYDKDTSKLDALADIGVNKCDDEADVVKKCKYVLLAVKPQGIDAALEAAAPFVNKDTVIISIAAGISEEYIKKMTIPDAKVVLVMPNTPLLLGEGASALAKAEPTTDEEFEFVKSIFASSGAAEVVPINKMKEIIAINGSSPAFIYLFAKGFTEYAKTVGIDDGAAMKLFAQSLIGSAKMLTDSGYTVDELIKMVSSPGGTTLAGLDEFYKGDLTGVVGKACESCTKRAYELSR
ncbi:MAG: pyrroline-5-carboxylate reductase [Oscillospiraceae bacterium]